MDPLELGGVLFAMVAFGAAAVAARRRRADVGWWAWAWAVLIVAGLALEIGGEWVLARAGGAVLAVVFPAMQLAGALEFTERRVPRWLIPAFLGLACVRLAVVAAGYEPWSHMAVVPVEVAALVCAAWLVLRPKPKRRLSPFEWIIGLGFVVISGAELIDAVLDTRGVGVSWSVWLVIGIPVGSCQVFAIFDRMQHQLASSVDERERALRAVEESNERFRAIAEEAEDVILEAHAGRGILYANPRFYGVLGYEPESVLGRPITDFAWDPEEFPSRADLDAEGGRVFGPVRMRHRDGSPRWMETSTRSYRRNGDLHLVLIARNVTDRLRSDEERRKAQKLESLGLMAGGIAHDFNNLLVGILGNADLARIDLEPGHPASSPVKLVIEAAEQAAQLTQQLQAYAGASPHELRRVDLSAEIQAQSDLVRTAVGDRARLELALGKGLPAVEADPGLLFQVVLNLAVNGADACGESGGTVRVATGRVRIESADLVPACGSLSTGDYVYVEVEDDGQGIEESTRERIFDPFFTTNTTGRGLGLAVVHGIVRTLGGAMLVESSPGKGSRFRLLLQIGGAPAAVRQPPRSARLEGTETLLVVDDDAIVLGVMGDALRSCGYEVLTASTGAQAIHAVTSHGIDLVLLDAVMPGESGEQILSKLRDVDPDVRVLLVSGYAEAEAMRRFARSGLVSGFLAKPFTRDVLAGRVRDVLDAPDD